MPEDFMQLNPDLFIAPPKALSIILLAVENIPKTCSCIWMVKPFGNSLTVELYMAYSSCLCHGRLIT